MNQVLKSFAALLLLLSAIQFTPVAFANDKKIAADADRLYRQAQNLFDTANTIPEYRAAEIKYLEVLPLFLYLQGRGVINERNLTLIIGDIYWNLGCIYRLVARLSPTLNLKLEYATLCVDHYYLSKAEYDKVDETWRPGDIALFNEVIDDFRLMQQQATLYPLTERTENRRLREN